LPGRPGVDGSPGNPGKQGPRGIQGATGVRGQPGNSVIGWNRALLHVALNIAKNSIFAISFHPITLMLAFCIEKNSPQMATIRNMLLAYLQQGGYGERGAWGPPAVKISKRVHLQRLHPRKFVLLLYEHIYIDALFEQLANTNLYELKVILR
uniref:Uncharacterized protein n=1 Tax=Parascaris equorum TaxID=6256 RepID=A0A914RJW3_PAREQ